MHTVLDTIYLYFGTYKYTNNFIHHIIYSIRNVKGNHSCPRPRRMHLRCPILRTNQGNRQQRSMRSPRNGNHQTQTWKQNWRTQDRTYLINSRTPMTSKLKPIFWPWSKMLSQSMTHAELTKKLNQSSEILLKLPVLVSSLPQTVSRMSELSSWSVTQSSKTQPALPTMSSFLSSFTFWADKDMLTAKNSSTSSFDCEYESKFVKFLLIYHYFVPLFLNRNSHFN